jgi:hypothetical protein
LKKFLNNDTKEVKQLHYGKSFDAVAFGTSLSNDGKSFSFFSILRKCHHIDCTDGVEVKRKSAEIVEEILENPPRIPSFHAFVESVLTYSQCFETQTNLES